MVSPGVRRVLLSSRDGESELAARAERWLPAGVPLLRLHT